jgi:integrase
MRVTHVHFWIDRLHLATLGDMSGILPKAESVLQELAGRDLAGKTLNNRREALMGFCTWLVKRGFLDDNPVKNLTRFDTTPQSRRRALTLDEIDALLAAAPPERRALYELALGSGLRLKELASLRVRNFDGVRKGLVLESAWTKGRRDGFLVLGDTPLTARLAAYCAGKDSETPLFNMPTRAARELQKDAKSAGISLETSEGKIDFHALRVTFISMLDRNGVTVRQGMELARHTTPGLTFGTYARATAGGLRDIMERIGNTLLHGEMQGDSKQRQAVGAEGLDVSGIPAGGLHASDKIGAAGSHPAGADSLEAI